MGRYQSKRDVIQKWSALQNIRALLDMLEHNKDIDFSCIIVTSEGNTHNTLAITGDNVLPFIDSMDNLIDQFDDAIRNKKNSENN